MFLGTKAFYVLNRKKNPRQKSYVEELPIPNIGIIKMNETQQRVLNIISKSYFKLRDPSSKTNKIIEEEGPGVITNEKLLQELKWTKVIKSGTRKRQQGATKLHAVIKKLLEKGYIEKKSGVPVMRKVGSGFVKQIGQGVIYKITAAGRRQAKNVIMLKE